MVVHNIGKYVASPKTPVLRIRIWTWSIYSEANCYVLYSKEEFSAALKAHKLTVVDAFATWCGPCKVIAPQVVKLVLPIPLSPLITEDWHRETNRYSEEFPDVHFTKIDVDDCPEVAQELGIRAMPTFLIFKGEEKVAEVVGANQKALEAAIKKAVDEAKDA